MIATAGTIPEVARDLFASVNGRLNRLPGKLRAWEVELLARLLVQFASGVAQAWEDFQVALADGGEAGVVRAICRHFLEVIDAYTSPVSRLRDRAGDDTSPTKVKALAELERAEEDMLAIRQRVDALLAWVSRPPSPVDPEQLEAARAAFAGGEYGTIQDDIARLEAGADL
jgi:hypothetical protein